MAGPSITGYVIPASVAARAKADVQFDLSGGATPYSNPFDDQIIAVDATVTAPGGATSTQPCSWEQPVTISTPTSGHGEIYGTPGTGHWWFHYKFPTTGVWTFQITAVDNAGITTGAVKSITVTAADATTLAVAGGNLSPWRLKNKWYFTFDDGTFIPMIGENLAVQDRPYQLDGTVGFTKFLADLANNGGGVVRYMLSAYHRNGLEWTSGSTMYSGFDNLYPGGVGKYSQQFAKRIDEFLRIATLNGVSVQFCTDTHGEFSTSSDPRWVDSPYNAANGGPVPSSDPALMYTNATATRYQYMKDRYIQARFAASPAFGAWELMNELGSVGNGFFVGNNTITNAAAWAATRVARVRGWAFNHLVALSEEWDPSAGKERTYPQNTDLMMIQVDIPESHNYNMSPWVINDRRHTEPDMIDNMRFRLNKPALHAESGLYRSPSIPEPNFDPTAGGKTQAQKDHLLAGTHVRAFALVNIANGFSGGWPWWSGSGLEDDASKNRTSGTLPYGGTAIDTWRYPQQYIFQAAAAIAAGEDPTVWPVPGGLLPVTAGAGLSARAWGYNQRALIYVEDTADNYGGSDVGNLVGRNFPARACTVSGLLDGAYNVEVWATRAIQPQVTFAAGDPTGVADSAGAIQSFLSANNGKVVAFPAGSTYRLNSQPIPTAWTGTILGNGSTWQPHYSSGTKFYAMEFERSNNVVCRDLVLDGSQVTTPVTTALLTNISNLREQEHAVAIYGGSNLTFINMTTNRFWGDGFWLTRDTLGGGDLSTPTNVVISGHIGDQLGRNGISVISSGGTCWYLSSTLTHIGFDGFDIEPNVAADVVGTWYVNGGTYATYDLINNAGGWGNGVAVSSGGTSSVTRPLLDVRNLVITKPSTSGVAFTIRNTTKFIADGNSTSAGTAANFTTVPTVIWGTNTNITPNPAKPFTAPPAITLPTLPGGGGKLSTIAATSASGSLTFTQPTVDRDAFYKIIPVGGGGGGSSVQVYDTGIRTVAPGGLGSADTGGAWTIGGTTGDYAVNGGQLALTGSVVGATRRGALLSTTWQEQDVHAKFQTDKTPTGSSQTVYLMGRALDLENNYYRAAVVFGTDSSIKIQIDSIVAGVQTVIGAQVTPGRDTYAVATEFWVRLQAIGVSPTTISAKVWKVGTTEPAGWDVTTTDSTAALQGPGAVGIRFYVGSAVSNTPVTARIDEVQGLDTSGGVSGTVATSFKFSPVASGSVGASGTSATAFKFTDSASGTVAAGQTSATVFSFATSASGGSGASGTSATAFRFAVLAVGVPTPPLTASRAVVIPSTGATLQSPNAYPQPAYQTLAITTQFWGGNSFIMNIGGAAQGASALLIGQLLWFPDEGNAVYEIESIETDKSGTSRANANLVVSGRSVDGFASAERLIIPDAGVNYDSQTGVSAETAMKHYVREHAGANALLPRQIPDLVVAPDLAHGATVSIDARYQKLGDALLQLGLLGPLGWNTTIDPATGNLVFDVINPTDRSASVFFDFDFGTVSSWLDVQSILASSTVAVVAGQGDLANRDVEVRFQGAEPTGFARREVFIDARDVALGDLATLDARGDAYLAANAPTRSTAATLYQFGSFQPGRDWFLGDIVLLHDAVLGINESARVVGLVKTYDRSAAVPTVVATVGKPFPGVAGSIAAPAGGAVDTVITSTGTIDAAVGAAIGGLSVGGANLVYNSSFESAVAGTWLIGANWTAPYTAGGIYGLASARCQLIGQVAGDLIPTNFIAVNPTDDYWISFWSYLSAYTSGVARFSVREYNATGALIGTTNIDQAVVELAPTRHSLHFGPDNTTPGRLAWQAATTRIKVVFLTPAASTLTWQVDAVQVERGKIITSYAPAPQELIDGQVGATQIADNAITTPKLIAGAIVAGKIAAGAITADKLAAQLVLGSLIKTADVGQRIELDSAGFRAIDGATPGNILVNIPTDPTRPVKVTGEIDATTLVVAGNAVLQGSKNELAASSVTQLDSYQSSPTQAPTLASSLDGVTMPLDATFEPATSGGFLRFGLDYDAAGGAGGATKVFYEVSTLRYPAKNVAWPGTVRLLELKASDRTLNRSVSLPIPDFALHPNVAATAVASVARLGSYIYVLISEVNGGPVYVTRVLASTFAVDATYGPLAGFANATMQIAFTTIRTGYSFRMEYLDNLFVDRGSSATFVVGTNFTAAVIQASLRTLTGDPGLTVSGTTDFGPFTITFSTGQPEQGFLGSLSGTGLVSGALGAYLNMFTFGGFTSYGGSNLGLASDGTNLYIAGIFDPTGNALSVRWNKYNATMVKQGATIDTTFQPGTGTYVMDAAAGNFDLGAARIAVLIGAGANAGTVQTFTTAGVRQVNEPWSNATALAGLAGGFSYGDALADGARFWSYDGAGSYASAVALSKHAPWTWTTATPIYQVAYSWYDGNATGGTHETQVGPRAAITMARRRQLTVTAQAIPGGGGTNDPNNIRVYMVASATDPGATGLKLQGTSTALSQVLTTYASGGAADSGSNSFSTVSVPGQLISQGTGFIFKGDGTINRTGSVFPTPVVAGDRYVRSDLGYTEWVYDGTRWLSAQRHLIALPIITGSEPGVATADVVWRMAHPGIGAGQDIWMERLDLEWFVSGGTALAPGTQQWVGIFQKVDATNAQTTIATITHASGTLNAWHPNAQALGGGSVLAVATYLSLILSYTKTGTPGGLYALPILSYRLIAV